ncbi:MAG: hypothetical protein MZV63_39070 [Marinilabiliales bacterium]|nr:hypothetical protein [Marinilabiliales bacterium]
MRRSARTRILDGEGFALLLDIDQYRLADSLGQEPWHELPQGMGHAAMMWSSISAFSLDGQETRRRCRRTYDFCHSEGRQLVRAYNSLHHETDIAMKSIARVFFNRINEINGWQ